MRCDVISPSSQPGSLLKSLLLKVVYQLVQPMGALTVRQGPMDAQCKLLQSMVYLDYGNANLSTALSILASAGKNLFFGKTIFENLKLIIVPFNLNSLH